MISRRDMAIGGGCLLATAAAYGLRPRRALSLLPPGAKLEHIIPTQVASWVGRDVGDVFAPTTKDALTTKLYESLVCRLYRNRDSSTEILALFAHGGIQSNSLQLHRPEVCYPAFGYAIVANNKLELPLGPQVQLPARHLAAKSEDAQQSIIYWTRMGEYLPTNGGEQRLERMQTALAGYIPDGLLARLSISGSDDVFATRIMSEFITTLIGAIDARQLPVLIGTERAKLLGASRR